MNDDDRYEPVQLASRSNSVGFAQRTLRNLEHIEKSKKDGDDVYVVTQRIVSLLGLVTFPWHAGLSDHIKKQRLEDLAREGWPQWSISLGSADKLCDLLRHVRNALAHRRVSFSSDDRDGSKVDVTFEDAKRENALIDWRAKINSDDLLDFCRKFTSLVENVLG
jgi:hypothetical protein